MDSDTDPVVKDWRTNATVVGIVWWFGDNIPCDLGANFTKKATTRVAQSYRVD